MSSYGWAVYPPAYPSQGLFEWVPCHDGQIPPGALAAGWDSDDTPLYVGRAYHNQDLLPAKVRAGQSGAYVAWGDAEHVKDQYEVLVSRDIAWKFEKNGARPPQALQVGHTQAGEPLYIGRVRYQGSLTPGKIHPSEGCIYIPYDGKEVKLFEYEVMVLL